MPNSQTPNFGLSQWVKQDKVLMEDFNTDNAKIDAALKAGSDARAALAAALATRGNCRVVYGSYTGNGGAGESAPCTLTFNGKPLAVFILPPTATGGYPIRIFLVRGSEAAYASDYYPNSGNFVTWGENRVSWYSHNDSVSFQLNIRQVNYPYVALLAADT